jgi:hypothetical protein
LNDTGRFRVAIKVVHERVTHSAASLPCTKRVQLEVLQ